MSDLPPPVINTPIFNSSYFTNPSDSLTFDTADGRYVRIGSNAFVSSLTATGNANVGSLTTSGNANVGSLSLAGVAVNLSVISGITAGTATASKALVLDASSNISGINAIRDLNILDFNPSSTSTKTILRKSTISGSTGIQVYDTQFITPTNNPAIDFRCDNNSSPIFFRMSGYLNNNSTVVSNGMPFEIRYQDGSGFLSGLQITCTNPSQALNNTYNVSLSARNGTIPHVVVNDRQNQTHIQPVDAVELNTSYGENVIIGKPTRFRDRIRIDGINSVVQIYNTAGTTSGRCSIDFINNLSSTFEFGVRNSGESPDGFYWYSGGAYRMCIRSDGRVGIGNITNPNAFLQVSGSVSTVLASAGVYGEYGSASSGNNQLGPITRNVSIRSDQGIMTSTSFFAVSDRRTKKDIDDLSLEEALDFVENVKPVKYRLRNEDESKNKHNGYIAQSLKNHIDLLNFSQHDDLPAEEDGDIENVQLSVDYSKVCVLLHRVILDQQLRIKVLEKKVELLITRPVVKKWFNKYSETTELSSRELSSLDGSVGSTQEQSEA